jgi:hypothetical protein
VAVSWQQAHPDQWKIVGRAKTMKIEAMTSAQKVMKRNFEFMAIP